MLHFFYAPDVPFAASKFKIAVTPLITGSIQSCPAAQILNYVLTGGCNRELSKWLLLRFFIDHAVGRQSSDHAS